MANYVVSDTSLTAVADAIRQKGGTSAQLEFPDEFVDAIGDIQTGGGSAVVQPLSVTENGTYTAPSGVDGYSPVTVAVQGGETPVPSDGKTRIWIHIAEGKNPLLKKFYLYFKSSVANNTTVDWGDGTIETKGTTSIGAADNYVHEYAQAGDYVITLTVNSGTITFYGESGSNGVSIYGTRSSSNSHNRPKIKRIVVGDNVTGLHEYSLYYCYALENVNIPNTNDTTTIGTYAFAYCYSLHSITVPENITTINAYAFSNCISMLEYHFKPTTPPVLSSNNIFQNINSNCIIYVPYSADHSILNAYKSATNWSSHSSKIQEEPA